MTAVSLQCKVRNHHPEWSNVGGSDGVCMQASHVKDGPLVACSYTMVLIGRDVSPVSYRPNNQLCPGGSYPAKACQVTIMSGLLSQRTIPSPPAVSSARAQG